MISSAEDVLSDSHKIDLFIPTLAYYLYYIKASWVQFVCAQREDI
jgi:hypothetical protein